MGIIKELLLKDYATLVGTLCGFAAVIFVIIPDRPAFRAASFMIFFGILADLLDGYIARKTQTFNELGKELDSLSDSFAFGVAPALIIFMQYIRGWGGVGMLTDAGIPGYNPYVLAIPVFISIAGVIVRLAWFNIADENSYYGLPSPVTASGLIMLYLTDYFVFELVGHTTLINEIIHYAIPWILILFAYFNLSDFIQFGKIVRKKTGNIKYLFLFAMLMLIYILVAYIIIYNTGAHGLVITVVIDIALLWLLFIGFILAGFINGIKSHKK